MTRDAWLRQLHERPDRPQGRQRRQLDVLVALADQLDSETGKGSVSLLELASAAGVSERTVRRAIGWATTSGLLERTSRGHRLGDDTTAPSGWQLLGQSEPQPANSEPQPDSSLALQVSSQPQPANSAEVPKARPAGRRSTSTSKPVKADIAKFRAWAAKQPGCHHGHPGGDQTDPAGTVLCPLCRREQETSS